MSTAIRFPSTTGLELDDVKQALRSAVRDYRSSRSARQRHEAADAFAEHGVEAVGDVRCVAAYVSNTTEPDTGPLLDALHARGITVLLPMLGPGLARDWGEYRGSADLDLRAPGRPPEPSGPPLGKDALGMAEAIIAPALAVDREGTRLGQGGGWYDRALLTRRADIPVFAMVHAAELVEEQLLPWEEHDVRVDAVITEERWFLLDRSAQQLDGRSAG
ncbi:5-formyltetrahydrofolate cyclo-ligase [Georgenia sp. MJ170]|uniref:5-formyltetrahydrofolate cyclo-ligase n=1 Tax=Georgenia sunbinii TaxID=3117728 RepID=UPI002F26468A